MVKHFFQHRLHKGAQIKKQKNMNKNLNFQIEKVIDHNQKLVGYSLTMDYKKPNKTNPFMEMMGMMQNMQDAGDNEQWKKNNNSSAPEKLFFQTEKELRDFIIFKISEF